MAFQQPIWPNDFTNRIREQFPGTADSFLASLAAESRVSVRINPAKFRLAPDEEPVPWCRSGYFLKERPFFALDPLWHAGAYYVQEASSMFLERVFEQIPKEHPLVVLDLCAAPGGKSSHMASLLTENDLLVSNEVIRSRVSVLVENMTKWGRSNTLVTSSDAKNFAVAGPLFDVLLIDAPCSGEGLFRRSPEAATEWSPDNAALCAVRQRRILADSWDCLKNGGYLIYSTCTFNPAENEENMHWLRSRGNFTSIPVPLDPEWDVDEITFQGIHGYRFLPFRVQGEGFFISLIRKEEETPQQRFQSKFRMQKPARIPEHWVTAPERKRFFMHQDRMRFVPAGLEQEISRLSDTVNLVKTGTTVGQVVRNEILPDHELAMSVDLNPGAFSRFELQKEQALHYLAREPVSLRTAASGWQIVTFCETPLGLIKNTGSRFNNYYPKNWRLRMPATSPASLWYAHPGE